MKISISVCVIIAGMFHFVFHKQAFPNTRTFIHPRPAKEDTNLVIPPAWAFGVLYGGYTNQEQTIQRIKDIQAHGYPIDAYWIDSWFWSYADSGKGPAHYIDFTGDTVNYPNRRKMWAFMHKNDIKGGFWIWNCILKNSNEKVFDEFRKRGYFSSITKYTSTWHNASSSTAMYEKGGANHPSTLCGNIDFKNLNAVAFFDQKMKHFFDEGVDFLKLDRTDAVDVCKAMFQLTQKYGKETNGRGFILSHSGGTNDKSYEKYPAKWTDDTRSDWTVEHPTKKFNPWVPEVAFKENIAMFTDPRKSTSHIPFLTNDMGGYDIGINKKPDDELFTRWLEFSMFCPITEDFSQPENPTSNLAYKYSSRTDTIFRYYAHLRLKLFPYLYSYAEKSRLTGIHMLRSVPGHLYEFKLGKELLIAPVYENGARSRYVYLPEGSWVNYWNGRILKGGRSYHVSAPINKVPIFVLMGALIPMRKYAASVEKGNNDTLYVNIYPGSNAHFTLYEDDGSSNDYMKGIYASTLFRLKNIEDGAQLSIGPCKGSYKGMKFARTWILLIHTRKKIKRISEDGRKLAFKSVDGAIRSESFGGEITRKRTIHIFYGLH